MNDHDPGLATLLDRLAPTTEAVPDWADALRRAEQQPRRGLFGSWTLAGIAVAGSLVALLVVVLVGLGRGEPGVIERADAALTARPHTILYERFVSVETEQPSGKMTRATQELWLSSEGDVRFIRSTNGGPPQEEGRASRAYHLTRFDRRSNTLRTSCVSPAGTFGDPLALIRRYLAAGKAKVVGSTTIDGHRALKIHSASPTETDELYVDRTTYYPIRVTAQFARPHRAHVVINFTTYRYERSTPATRALTSIQAQHPHAKRVGC